MKKWILHILLFASLFSMLTTSCSQDEEVMQVGSTSGTVRIQFSLDMDGTRAAADETWGTTTTTDDNLKRVIGNDYENKIDLGRLQVFLFDSDGRYMGEVGGLTLNPSNSSFNTYTFTGEVTVKGVDVTIKNGVKMLEGYTIMVTANYEGYINGNLAVTQNYIFDYIAANYRPNANGVANSYIPMWGMLTTDIPLHEDRATASTAASNPVNIYMLRSLAKIEVTLKDELYTNGYRITGATLNKSKSQAYVLPAKPSKGYLGTDDYDSTSDFLTSGCNPVNDATIQYDNELFNVSSNQKTWVIYVPEMEKGTDNAPNKVSLQLGRVTDTDASGNEMITNITESVMSGNPHIVLKDYAQGGSHFDITRNWYYQYTINQINDGIDLEFTLNVAPWTLVEKTIDYSSETISITTDDDGLGWHNIQTTSTTNNKYMIAGADVVFKFRIDTPLYCEYYVDLSGEGFTITTSDEICVDSTGQPNGATEVTVTIGARDDGENHEGILRIFVKEDGRYKEVPGAHRYTIIKNYE